MEPTSERLKWFLKLLGVAPKLYEQLKEWRGQPSRDDRNRVVRYCRRLDERRVFSAPFNVEVEEVCIASLAQVKDYTDEVLAELEHPAARAGIGAILDEVRKFLDKWQGYRGHRGHWDFSPFDSRSGEEMRDFFEDLGELRGRMKLLVGMLIELVPEAAAPKLLGT